MRSSKGTNRKSPAKGVRNEQGGQIQAAHVGHPGDLRFHRNRAFVVGAAGKPGEALFAQQDGEGVDADGMTGGSEFALHVIDGEIAFAHGNRQIANAVAGGRGLRTAMRHAEEGSAFLRVVAELIQRTRKAPGD